MSSPRFFRVKTDTYESMGEAKEGEVNGLTRTEISMIDHWMRASHLSSDLNDKYKEILKNAEKNPNPLLNLLKDEELKELGIQKKAP